MRGYLIKILIFLALYFAVLFAIYIQPYKYDNFFQSAETKTERLKKKEPQIIFVGGSNTLFGVDSKMVAEALDYDVVNMGIHMGLGYYFQTQQVINELQSDDIVLLSPEYVSYYQDKVISKHMLNQISEHYPSVLLQFDHLNRPKLLYDHFLDKIKKNISYIQAGKSYKLGPVDGYSFSGVNEYGDQTDQLSIEKGSKLGQWNMKIYQGKELHEVFLKQTSRIVDRCKQLGCKVFFTFPALAESAYDNRVANTLVKSLDDLGYTRLGHPRAYVYPNAGFYDTHYHPLRKVRAQRTALVIKELKKKL